MITKLNSALFKSEAEVKAELGKNKFSAMFLFSTHFLGITSKATKLTMRK